MNMINNDCDKILSRVNNTNMPLKDKNRLIDIIKITNVPKKKPFLNFLIVVSIIIIFCVLAFVIAMVYPNNNSTEITDILFPVIFFLDNDKQAVETILGYKTAKCPSNSEFIDAIAYQIAKGHDTSLISLGSEDRQTN